MLILIFRKQRRSFLFFGLFLKLLRENPCGLSFIYVIGKSIRKMRVEIRSLFSSLIISLKIKVDKDGKKLIPVQKNSGCWELI